MSTVIDGSAGITTNAGGSVNPSTNIDGINYSCRAWVNFNGTGTPAIRASGNVTNITDNGTGNYTVNFTTAMTDTNYSAVGSCGSPSAAHGIFTFFAGTGTVTGTGGVQFATVTANGSSTQFDYVNVFLAVFR